MSRLSRRALLSGAAGGGLALALRQAVDDDPDLKTQEAIDPAHGLGVAAGQVVVHRDHMHAAAGERIEVGGQGGHEGFALAGFHLGDLAVVQHHAADQLDVVMPHLQHAASGFADDGEGFGQQVVEGLAALEALPEVSYCVVVAGAYDLLIEVVCEDNDALLTFLTDRLRSIEGVLETETFVYLRILKQNYEWGTTPT